MDALSREGRADRKELRALIVLDGAPGLGLVSLRKLVQRFGSARAALRARPEECRRVARAFERPGADAWRAAERALDEAERLGMIVISWSDTSYPPALHNLHDPPPLLFLRGRSELLARRSITVVGSRRSTSRSRNVAERLGSRLARAGLCVASGMALGVDGAAHRGALAAGGDTVAVLGRGADRAYPLSHGRLFRDILERGLVVSEFTPGTPPLPHHFPRRNRILAALSRAVVVVEAGERSGALITVDHALDLGVDVWAVPGPIELAACVGSNRLLADGARPLLSVDDFVEHLGGKAPVRAVAPKGPERRVLVALMDEPLNVDQLAVKLDISPAEALSLLTRLELEGAVRRMPGMRFAAAA